MSPPAQICQKEVFIHDPFALTIAQILQVYIEHKCIYFSYWKISGKIFPFLNKPLEVSANATICRVECCHTCHWMVSCHPWGHREVIYSSSPQNIPHARDVLRQCSMLVVIVWKQFVKYNSLSPIEINEGCKNDSYLTYFKSQFDIYNLWKLFLKVAVFKMYWIYHMPH